jgi:preprotein translocase subunit SecA
MRLQDREARRRDFLQQVKNLFDDFLAEHVEQARRDEIWQKAADRITPAFSRFNVERLSDKRAREEQQNRFQEQVDGALRELLTESLASLDQEKLIVALKEYARRRRQGWRESIKDESYETFGRTLLLSAIDAEWRDYLVAVDDLRREIGLEAFGQRDPKVEFKRRSYQMFNEMRGNIDRAVVNRFFVEIDRHQEFVQRQKERVAYREQMSQAGYQLGKGGAGLRREMPKVGRNDPCPCGSGKKYKQCHGRQEQAPANGGDGARVAPVSAQQPHRGKKRH